MKFIAAALACYILILGFCVGNSYYMTKKIGETEAALAASQEAAGAGETDLALRRLAGARAAWDEKHTYYTVVVPHRTLDSVSLSFVRCESLLAGGSLPEFDAEMAVLRRMLAQLLESERFSSGNVF